MLSIVLILNKFKQFLRLRTRVFSIPFESWNLRLVNIQRNLKDHVRNFSAEQLQSKRSGRQGTPAPSTFYPPPGLHLSVGLAPVCNFLPSLFNPSQVQAPAQIPNLFRVFGNSKTLRKPHYNDQFFDQTSFCKQWLKTISFNFDPTPPPNIKPMSRVKNVGAEAERCEDILSNFSFEGGYEVPLSRLRTKTRASCGFAWTTPLLGIVLFQLVLVPSRWEVLTLDPAAVLSEHRGILTGSCRGLCSPVTNTSTPNTSRMPTAPSRKNVSQFL